MNLHEFDSSRVPTWFNQRSNLIQSEFQLDSSCSSPWFKSCMTWFKSLLTWFKSFMSWFKSFMPWFKSFMFWFKSFLSWFKSFMTLFELFMTCHFFSRQSNFPPILSRHSDWSDQSSDLKQLPFSDVLPQKVSPTRSSILLSLARTEGKNPVTS